MPTLTSKPRTLRSGITAVDSSDASSPDDKSVLQHNDDGYLVFWVTLTGAATALVQARGYCEIADAWFDVPDGALSFTEIGTQQLRLENPGGPVWLRVEALAEGGAISVAGSTQRRKL